MPRKKGRGEGGRAGEETTERAWVQVPEGPSVRQSGSRGTYPSLIGFCLFVCLFVFDMKTKKNILLNLVEKLIFKDYNK